MLSTDHFGTLPLLHYLHTPDRSQRIATGTLVRGMAIMTREVLEQHIEQTPGVKGVWDYVPVAERRNSFGRSGVDRGVRFVGWRQKLRTW